MTPWKIALAAAAALALVIMTVILTAVIVTWAVRREYRDRPPEVISGSSTMEKVEDEESAGRFSITEGSAEVTGRGRSDPLPMDSPEREQQRGYVADVLQSEELELPDGLESVEKPPPPGAPGLLPPVRTMREDDMGAISVMDSRGAWQREETRCPDGRRWEAGTTLDGTGFYANCERAITGFLPNVGKKALKCGLAAAAGYGVGWAVNKLSEEEDNPATPEDESQEQVVDPWLPAAGTGGICIVMEITG